MNHWVLFVVCSVAWTVACWGPTVRDRWKIRQGRLTEFAERVQQELRNPDPDVRAALREVDRIGWAAPPVAVPEPVAPTMIAPTLPTLVGGNSVWRAPAPTLASIQANALAEAANAAQACQARALIDAAQDRRPWFWPYVFANLGSDRYLLHERFGGATVTRKWLEMHRHDIVQAVRKGNFEC